MRMRLYFFLYFLTIVIPGYTQTEVEDNQFGFQQSGFLSDYSGFMPGEHDEGRWIYRHPHIDIGHYEKIILQPILVYLREDSQSVEIQPDELTKLTSYFHKAAISAIPDNYQLTTKPGESVMIVRSALTNLVPVSPCLSILSNIPSPVRAMSTCNVIKTGEYLFVGIADIEVEILDSLTHERIIAIIDRKSGDRKVLKKHTRWADIKLAFDEWAARFGQKLQQARDRIQPMDSSAHPKPSSDAIKTE